MKVRQIFYILFTIVLTVNSYAQKNEFNQKNENGERFGIWKGYYPNGVLRYTGTFDNNKPTGTFNYYFESGDLKTILKYRNPSESEAILFYQNGNKMAEGKYVDQLKDSIWMTYSETSAVPIEFGEYKKGKKFGIWRTFHLNGQMSQIVKYEDDLKQDTLKSFYPNGKLKQVSIYKDGELNGFTTFYELSGKIALRGLYKMGRRDKNWLYYTTKGSIEKTLKYDNGKLMNPEVLDDVDYNTEEFKNNRKQFLEFEDFIGNIKYE